MPSTTAQVGATVDVDLTGRSALVTGAASGIGLACAQRLAAAGARVVLVDRDAAGLATAAGLVGGETMTLDLSRGADMPSALDVDVLVNNAGFQHVSPIVDFPPDVFAQMLAVMVEAPFRLIRAALPGMYERGWGRVINITSVHGLVASPHKAGYVAAKHAIEGLSKVVALEAGPHGVTSNCVSPGYVRTPLVEAQIADQAILNNISPDKVVSEVLLTQTAIKRMLEPDEVAEMVAYLCTPAAALINGVSLTIDGGWTAR